MLTFYAGHPHNSFHSHVVDTDTANGEKRPTWAIGIPSKVEVSGLNYLTVQSSLYVLESFIRASAMLGAMGDMKMSKTKTAFLPFKEFMFFYVPFVGSPLVINFMWQNSNHRKEYIMKSNTHSPPIPVHYHFPGDKYVYQSFRYFLWDFVCLNIHTCLQIL